MLLSGIIRFFLISWTAPRVGERVQQNWALKSQNGALFTYIPPFPPVHQISQDPDQGYPWLCRKGWTLKSQTLYWPVVTLRCSLEGHRSDHARITVIQIKYHPRGPSRQERWVCVKQVLDVRWLLWTMVVVSFLAVIAGICAVCGGACCRWWCRWFVWQVSHT